MKLLEFTAPEITPTKKGEYILIDESLNYIHAKAVFDGNTFIGFSPRGGCKALQNNEVLAYSTIASSNTVIRQLYTQQKQSQPAALKAV